MRCRRLFDILTAPLLEIMRTNGLPMPPAPSRFYPDGSLEAEVDPDSGKPQRLDPNDWQDSLITVATAATFRPIAPFGGDREDANPYAVRYPMSYDWLGEGETGVLVYPGVYTPVREDEYDLQHIRVHVRLRRKFTPELASELAQSVGQWFSEVGSRGVFGESGVSSLSPQMHYQNRSAGFELDARATGQETLNTLYLAVLNWAMTHRRPLVLTELGVDGNEAVFTSEASVPMR